MGASFREGRTRRFGSLRPHYRFFLQTLQGGKKPGFPRFKPSRRWRSIEMPDPTASMLRAPETPKNQSARWWRLSVKGVPRVRFRDKGNRIATALGMGASVKELRVVRTPLRVELHVVLKHPDRELPERPITNPVGVDKGIHHRMTLSDGTRIPARTVDLNDHQETTHPEQSHPGSPGQRKSIG